MFFHLNGWGTVSVTLLIVNAGKLDIKQTTSNHPVRMISNFLLCCNDFWTMTTGCLYLGLPASCHLVLN